MAFTAIFAGAIVGLLTFYTQSTERRTQLALKEAGNQVARNEIQVFATNALSRFRALSAERRDELGRYSPALFAKNYFDGIWDLTRNDALGALDIALEKSGVTFRASALASAQNFHLKILKINFSDDQRVAQSMDVALSMADSASQGQARNFDMKARIDLMAPVPHDPKLQYRKKGDSVWLDNVSSLTQAGSYEFRVLGSGVVYAAQLKVNDDTYTLGGFDSLGRISHAASSYSAKDVPIGDPVAVDIGQVTASPSSPAPMGSFNQTKCVFESSGTSSSAGSPMPAVSSYTFQVILEGVDKSSLVAGNPSKVSLAPLPSSSAVQNGSKLALGDYQAFCTDQCPFLPNDPNADIIAERAEKGIKGDMSSAWTFADANEFQVFNQKMCINFDKVGRSDFDAADLIVYDIPSCKRAYLFTRLNCGCVAEDSMILLGDGRTEKRISDLSDQDRVWNPLVQASLGIRRITRGPESSKPLLLIRVGDKELRVTGQHPFPSSRGERKAYELEVGDLLLTERGNSEAIRSIEAFWPKEDGAPVVWNLELEAPDDELDAHHMLVNGIVTGDLLIQVLGEQRH